MAELRKKKCFWHVPFDMTYVRLDPNGEPLEVLEDEEGRLYVIDRDGERTYIVFG